MKGLLEFKNVNTSQTVKDVDFKNRVVTGYLSEFGSTDFDNDIMVKGCYQKSLQERRNKIVFLNHHNFQQPHGFFDVLIEDEKGLYFESAPLIDTSYSTDALKLYEAGILKEHSVGFVTMKAINSMDYNGAREITEAKLYEGSCVTLGANENTPFLGFKSLTKLADIEEKSNAIIKMLRTGSLTDETFISLEIALKQLQRQCIILGEQKALKERKPSKDTSQEFKPLIADIYNFIKD